MDISVEIIGVIGATLTTASFVPQVYKMVKTKSVEGISLTMYSVFFVGILFWLYYGIKIDSFSVILANTVTGILVVIILLYRIIYGNKNKEK
jgi:MtN3 and saliva related transmembrane protein